MATISFRRSADWSKLARRCENATVSDQAIDRAVHELRTHTEVTALVTEKCPEVSSSVDAVLTLISETLPGWSSALTEGDLTEMNPTLRLARGRLQPYSGNHEGRSYGSVTAFAATPALALLAAYCKAASLLSRIDRLAGAAAGNEDSEEV